MDRGEEEIRENWAVGIPEKYEFPKGQ